MTITISEGSTNSYVVLSAKDERFIREWGQQIECHSTGMYKNLAMISAWANNTYHEACLFEVD